LDELPLSTFIVLVSLILLSAFFSSAETAFSSVNRIRLKNFVDEGRKGSKKALLIAENFDKTITTILIGNNIVNTAAASISAALAIQLFGNNSALVISTVMITLLIIIFGEILPKSLAKERAESYSLAISGVLFWLIKIFTPISYLFIKLKSGVTKLFKKRDLEELPSVTEEEIKTIIDISEEEGVIDKEERELIVNSMNFDDTLVEEVLTPRIDMVAISIDQSIDEVKKVFFEERYSRIPVYEDNIDNIVGILFEKDFFFHLNEFHKSQPLHLKGFKT
jgi:putative hemolysin